MAKVYISEFAGIGTGVPGANAAQAPYQPSLAEQVVAIGGSSVPSAKFGANTRYIRVHTDAICSVRVDAAADANSARMAAGQTEYYAVKPGSTLNVITNT